MAHSPFLPHVRNSVPQPIRAIAIEAIAEVEELLSEAAKKSKKAGTDAAGPDDDATELEAMLPEVATRFMPIEKASEDKKTALGKGGFTRASLLAHLRGMPAGSTRRLFLLSVAAEMLRTRQPELTEANALLIIAMHAG